MSRQLPNDLFCAVYWAFSELIPQSYGLKVSFVFLDDVSWRADLALSRLTLADPGCQFVSQRSR